MTLCLNPQLIHCQRGDPQLGSHGVCVVPDNGESSSIFDCGWGLLVDIGSSGGTDVISCFTVGGDMINLLKATGGHLSVSQIPSALHTASHGGTLHPQSLKRIRVPATFPTPINRR